MVVTAHVSPYIHSSMFATASSNLRQPSKGKSAVSNGKFLCVGVDHRSATARRFRDLVHSFAKGLGGLDRLTEAERTLVKQAATLTVAAEQLQAAVVRGERVDP